MASKMTKNEALELLGCSVVELSKLLGLTSQAISMWPKDRIPLAREYQIRDIAAGRAPLTDKSFETQKEKI